MERSRIYLDYSATTPVSEEVLEAMMPFFSEIFGNASSIHKDGILAREAVERARETIKNSLNSKEHRVIFTSGGTESNNLAIKGVAFGNREKGRHIITTKVEHECVLNACRWLEKVGFEVTYLDVDSKGFVNPETLEEAIREDTILVSVIHGNNEIGTIQNLREIGEICHDRGVLFHTDACQSFMKTDINLKRDPVDLMTINAHKIYGPKGVGALIAHEDVHLEPLLHGGGHEYGLRSGTLNTPGIVGFSKAVEVFKPEFVENMRKTRDLLIQGALEIDETKLNGPEGDFRLCNNANITFRGAEGEAILTYLDEHGISVSTGSACSSASGEPSHVLLAIGLSPLDARCSIRFSTGKETKKEDVEIVLEILKEGVEKLRELSPLGRKI